MSSTERTNKRKKYIIHNIIVLTTCCCCAMFAKYINVDDHACRFSVDLNVVAVHNTLQGSKARDRVATLKTMDRLAHDVDERHVVPWERTPPQW